MDFSLDLIESIPSAINTVTKSVNIIKWIADQYQKRRASRQGNDPQDDERMDACFLKTLYTLRQESEDKKLEYIQCFAKKTILRDPCDLDTDTILSLLMDIEQMTWRQICLIEGFSRRQRADIEIKGMIFSGMNGQLRMSDTKKLVNLHYLSLTEGIFSSKGDGLLETDKIRIRETGIELAQLMDLESIPIDEIARAFGQGMITETRTY